MSHNILHHIIHIYINTKHKLKMYNNEVPVQLKSINIQMCIVKIAHRLNHNSTIHTITLAHVLTKIIRVL